jgi:hypothetical protein
MKRTFLLLIFLVIIISNSSGQEVQKKRYDATRLHSPITIDGNLSEADWQTGRWEDDFTQREPYEGKAPRQKTTFKILYDDNFIYVGIKAFDSAPDSIVRRMSRRDNLDGDYVGISFDSYHDRRTAFNFIVTASGVKDDATMTNDGDNEDDTWDPIWYVKTSMTSWGWSAEMKIPFTQLRFNKNSSSVWGLEVVRYIYRYAETDFWQPIARNAPGFVHLYGELGGLSNIKPKKQLDLTPYMVAGVESYPKEEGNPFSTGHKNRFKAGLDGKIGLTNNLTLDFTINPDFGQVEADPSEVNLTAFETFFREKRPFFIEGKNITSFSLGFGDGDLSQENLFYSRRIGRRPQYETDLRDNEYIDSPKNTSIIGAAKLTGKTESGWSVGVIESVAAEEKAKIAYEGKQRSQAVEPLTNYFVSRVQKDLNKGNTLIGGMVTNTSRQLDDVLKNYLHRTATTGGFDFTQYFDNKNYIFTLNAAFSKVDGTKEALLETQTSSRHYFQRPDATHIHLDSTRTSLSGFGGNMQFGKTGGNLKFLLAAMAKSPGLELNDVGYLRSTDQIFQVFWMGYRFNEPKGIMRKANLNLNQWNVWDFSGQYLNSGGNINGYIEFKNYWSFHGGVNFDSDEVDNYILRGGPGMIVPGGMNIWYGIETDERKKLKLSYFGSNNWNKYNSRTSSSYSPEIEYRPNNTLNFSLEPSLYKQKRELQYVNEYSFNGDNRYLMAHLDQKVLSFSMRVNINLTPDLTIQYWGQPFFASGKYKDFKKITAPKADLFSDRYSLYTPDQLTYNSSDEIYYIDENQDGTTDYSFEQPNFNFNEFLSNLVVRWEYTPGSTVYLVWSQSRDYSDSLGDFSLDQGFDDLFNGDQPHNVFLIKFSYRIGLH